MQRFKVGPRMSQAVILNGVIHIAGQVADDRKTGVAEQTAQVLAKIEALLKEAGSDKSKLAAVNVFLPNIVDFDAMNVIYDAWIDKAKGVVGLPIERAMELSVHDLNQPKPSKEGGK